MTKTCFFCENFQTYRHVLVSCAFCGCVLDLRQWVIDEYEKRGLKIYCSPECKYIDEHGGVMPGKKESL